MRLTPDNVTLIGEWLDHPECVCTAADGTLYAGGEAGQVYRITQDGRQTVHGLTDGFILGIALDDDGAIHACDLKHQAVMRISPDGSVIERSRGMAQRAMVIPNYGVFDTDGNLYVSDSGDYWHPSGTGCIYVIAPNGDTWQFHPGPLRFPNGLAIDPTSRWLYVVLSTACCVVRLPLDQSDAEPEVTHRCPPGTVPDGLAFASDGSLLIGCYKPDAVLLGQTNGRVETLFEDPTGELLSRPTNVALHDGKAYIANLGGWHITAVDTELTSGLIHRPRLSSC